MHGSATPNGAEGARVKFIANISMCDSTYYVPLAQAAEAAGDYSKHEGELNG